MLTAMLAHSAGGQLPQGCRNAGTALSAAFDPEAESLVAITPRFGQPPAADVALNSTNLQVGETGQSAAQASTLPGAPVARVKSAFDGDFLIVGIGAAFVPDYEGSSGRSPIAAGAFAGKLGGIGISPRAAGFSLNLVPQPGGARIGLSLGPVFRLRMNRAGNIRDPVVASLGKLRTIFEGGVNIGLSAKRVFNGNDQLSIGADFRWDIAGKGGGGVISPTVSYLTPISKAQVIGFLASAEFANGSFARYNYSISPAGSAASGLPVFAARGGLKSLNFGAFTARDLDGNLLNGGFSIALGAMYTRLQGSAARTPLTAIRGHARQWVFAAGVGYTF